MIYLLSGSGGPNFGDELIVRKWLSHYAENHPGIPLHLDSKSIGPSKQIHGEANPHTQFFFFLKRLSHDKAPGTFWEHSARGFEFIMTNAPALMRQPRQWKPRGLWERLGPRKNFVTLDDRGHKLRMAPHKLPDFTKLQMIHLVGGGYISGSWPNSGFLLGCCAALKRLFGIPLVATGLGVSPLPAPPPEWERFMRSLLEDFDIFETRDKESHASISAILGGHGNALLGLDDAFLDSPVTKASTELENGPKELPSLHLSFFAKVNRFNSNGEFIEDIRRVSESFGQVYFWLCCQPDKEVCWALKKAIPKMKVLKPRDLVYGEIPMKSTDFMITSRFHPHLVAAGTGMSGVYLAQSRFYTVKHRSVKALGSSFVGLGKDQTLLAAVEEALHHPEANQLQLKKKRLFLQKQEIVHSIGTLLASSQEKLGITGEI